MGYNKNHRTFVENKIISFLESEDNPQPVDTIIEFLRDQGVTLETDKIQTILGYLEGDEKILVVKSKEKYRLTINPKWNEINERRERAELRRYMRRGQAS